MRYIDVGHQVIPKHCIYGPRPAEGVVFNNVEWWSINDHLIKDQREKELARVLREQQEAKKELSYNMTKTWKNTLASIKTLGNQRRIEKMEKDKQDKIDQYNEIIKNRKEQKKELMENIKKILFENDDVVKTINCAVLMSTVIDERKKQIEFKKASEELEVIKEKEEAEKYKKEAEAFARERIEAKLKEKFKKQKQKLYLDKQMEELKKKKQAEAEELLAEKEDLKNMKIEAEKIHYCNMVEQKYRKEFAAKYIQKTQTQLEHERLLVLEEEEEDAINQLYLNYNRRFKKERKEREKKMKDEVVQRRNKIAEELAEKIQALAKKKQDFLDSAAEKVEVDNKEALRQKALADVLEGKRRSEEERAMKNYELQQQKKWEMMQQYRSAEVNEEWREERKRKAKEQQMYRKTGYDKQVLEMKLARDRDRQESLKPLVSEEKEREKIRDYCQSTLEWVRENNLPEYPVLATIKKMQKVGGNKDAKKEDKQNDDQDLKMQKPKPLTGYCYYFKD